MFFKRKVPLLYVHDYLVLFRREVAPIISHFPTTYTTSTKLYPEAFLAPKLPTVNVERDKEREMEGRTKETMNKVWGKIDDC